MPLRLGTRWNKQLGAEQFILADQFSVVFDFFGFSDVFISDRGKRKIIYAVSKSLKKGVENDSSPGVWNAERLWLL